MREIFVNGVAFRYKTERDLSLILRHARQPARLQPLVGLVSEVQKRRKMISGIKAECANSLACIETD